MWNSDQASGKQTHVALFPSAGMGHLTPFLRLAHMLIRHNCKLTLITSHPTVSSAESRLISHFLSAFPQITELKLHISPVANSDDPFFLQFEAIHGSVHRLTPLLSALSPPLSVLICDALLISSAAVLSLFAHYSFVKMPHPSTHFLPIPAIRPIPKSSIPPLLLQNCIFQRLFKQNGQRIKELNGILINAMDAMKGDTPRRD